MTALATDPASAIIAMIRAVSMLSAVSSTEASGVSLADKECLRTRVIESAERDLPHSLDVCRASSSPVAIPKIVQREREIAQPRSVRDRQLCQDCDSILGWRDGFGVPAEGAIAVAEVVQRDRQAGHNGTVCADQPSVDGNCLFCGCQGITVP